MIKISKMFSFRKLGRRKRCRLQEQFSREDMATWRKEQLGWPKGIRDGFLVKGSLELRT